MAASYRVLILRASDGEPLGEVPANSLSWTRVLTSTGGCSFALPPDKAARSLIGPGLGREVAVIRDNVSCEFNGPIVGVERVGDSVNVRCLDPGYYLARRVTEGQRNYGRPVLDAVRNLVEMATGAVPGGQPKPNPGLYRLTVSGSGGPAKRWTIASTDRLPILEVIEDLAEEEGAGFDYRWDYGYAKANMVVSRVFALASPRIGVDRRRDIVLEPPHLTAYQDEENLDRAANRVHVLGSGEGKAQIRSVAVNTTSLNSGLPLLETVVERTTVRLKTTLDGMAREYRRILAPPVRLIQTTHRAGSIAYRAADLGDTIGVRLPTDAVPLPRRIVAETVEVDDAGEESVTYTYNDPTDQVVD